MEQAPDKNGFNPQLSQPCRESSARRSDAAAQVRRSAAKYLRERFLPLFAMDVPKCTCHQCLVTALKQHVTRKQSCKNQVFRMVPYRQLCLLEGMGNACICDLCISTGGCQKQKTCYACNDTNSEAPVLQARLHMHT